jgi:branched-chain amino acid transport system permease protein
VRRSYALAFAVGTALTGVAASLMAPIYSIEPEVGDTFGVMAFIVVILGGLGSVFGASAAALLIGVAQSVFATLVSVQMSTAFVFLVFIVAMIARPNGLFGRTARVA